MRRAEWAVALILTLAVVCLHLTSASFAGALWRDEANTVGVATLPTLSDVWHNLHYDSFPIIWLLIVRGLSALFGVMNDPAFRTFGFLVGVGTVGVLWLNARTFGHSVPLLSLPLVSMSPSVIRWGDSLRAYGFGIFLILLTSALLWRFLQRPSIGRLVVVAVAAVASVHVLFYNAVLLLALCSGAVAVCARRQSWGTAVAVLLIGALAAVSLLPYIETIRSASRWNMLMQIPDYTMSWFWDRLAITVGAGGMGAFVGWVEASGLAVICGILAIASRNRFRVADRERDVALFSLVTFVIAIVAVFLFLHVLSYPTQPWYYLALLGLSGVCIDAVFGAVIHSRFPRIVRLAGVLLIAGSTIIPAVRAARTRLTNVDLIASRLRTIASANDIVLVSSWQNGVSFERYYRGPTPWLTVPPLGFSRFQRYDLIKQYMRVADQTLPARLATDRATEALQRGHRVFVVEDSFFASQAHAPHVLPPAPLSGGRWPESLYSEQWTAMVRDFLERHAGRLAILLVRSPASISGFENLTLLVADGWRP